jgi:hypothetical protein
MLAATAKQAGVVKLLLDRGADGTKYINNLDVRATALVIVRCFADGFRAHGQVRMSGYAETLAVLCRSCCSKCGKTSAGMSATTTTTAAAAGRVPHLKHCPLCLASGPRAHYCGKECQRADWARHREEHRRVE